MKCCWVWGKERTSKDEKRWDTARPPKTYQTSCLTRERNEWNQRKSVKIYKNPSMLYCWTSFHSTCNLLLILLCGSLTCITLHTYLSTYIHSNREAASAVAAVEAASYNTHDGKEIFILLLYIHIYRGREKNVHKIFYIVSSLYFFFSILLFLLAEMEYNDHTWCRIYVCGIKNAEEKSGKILCRRLRLYVHIMYDDGNILEFHF